MTPEPTILDGGNIVHEPRHTRASLLQYQSLSLDAKVRLSILRIRAWYEHWQGQVYVSVSGGLDSTVLAHLVRSVYPDVPLVFFDTGLEYPENRRQCQEMGAEFIRPKRTFQEVIERCGYPVVSKKVSQYVGEVQSAFRKGNPNSATVRLRTTGYNTAGIYHPLAIISTKWRFLIDAPFRVSARCCHALKRQPAEAVRSRGLQPFIGTRATESLNREQAWYRWGCNMLDGNNPRSMPLSFWSDADVWAYIRANNVRYSALYDMGYKRSGCMFCMFGCHLEGLPNRFQRMKETHPKQWAFCMDKLGLRRVLDYIKVPYDDGPLMRQAQGRLMKAQEKLC
jgi:3'-phosphoadenosine 5'-phosphosulfate sulfotransferase (PAPS reductase)/FAD synthetase